MNQHDWNKENVCNKCDRARSPLTIGFDSECDGCPVQKLWPSPPLVDPREPRDALILLATVCRSRESAFQAERIERAIKTLRALVENFEEGTL